MLKYLILKYYQIIAIALARAAVMFLQWMKIPRRNPYRRRYRKVYRNELCPCGSGKKYKHCCKNLNQDGSYSF